MRKQKYFISKHSRSINWQWPLHLATPRVIKQFTYQQTFKTFKIFFISKVKNFVFQEHILSSITKTERKIRRIKTSH